MGKGRTLEQRMLRRLKYFSENKNERREEFVRHKERFDQIKSVSQIVNHLKKIMSIKNFDINNSKKEIQEKVFGDYQILDFSIRGGCHIKNQKTNEEFWVVFKENGNLQYENTKKIKMKFQDKLPLYLPIFANILGDTFFIISPYIKGIDNSGGIKDGLNIINYFESKNEENIKKTAEKIVQKLYSCLQNGFNPMLDCNLLSLWNLKVDVDSQDGNFIDFLEGNIEIANVIDYKIELNRIIQISIEVLNNLSNKNYNYTQTKKYKYFDIVILEELKKLIL